MLPAKTIRRPPRQYPGNQWIMPLGAKVEAISLKPSESRQRGGNVSKVYSDGADSISKGNTSGETYRRIGVLAYWRFRGFIIFRKDFLFLSIRCSGKWSY